MEQVNIKIEPGTYNDDTQQMDMSTLDFEKDEIELDIYIKHEPEIKEEPNSDEQCSELIDNTQVCDNTSQSSDGVAMHIKEEPAADVGYDEPTYINSKSLVAQLMDIKTESGHSLLPVRLKEEVEDSVDPLKILSVRSVQQQVVLSGLGTDDVSVKSNIMFQQANIGLDLLPVPVKTEVEHTVDCLEVSRESVHKQQVVPSGLSTDDVCVSGNSDTRVVNVKERAKCTATGNTYQCDVCHKCFSRKDTLKIHIRTHTGEKPYKCKSCHKRFIQSSHLQTHSCRHTGKKPHECDTCNKTFSSQFQLKRHLRIHTGDRPYKCDQCNKRFSEQTSFKRHLRVHTGDRPFKCDVCNKRFTQAAALKIHKHTHTGERPYKCEICDKRFNQSSILNVHLRTHTEKKPYTCDVCNKCFTNAGYLKKHMLTHTSKKIYKCDV